MRKVLVEFQYELVGELFERVLLGKKSLEELKPRVRHTRGLARGMHVLKREDTFEIASAEREKAAWAWIYVGSSSIGMPSCKQLSCSSAGNAAQRST